MKIKGLWFVVRGRSGSEGLSDGLIAATRGHGVVAREVRRAAGRGIGANVEMEDSSSGTRGQLVEGTVEVQVDEIPSSPWADAKENQVRFGSAPLGKELPVCPRFPGASSSGKRQQVRDYE
jgi:hypothetical protein